MFRDVGRRNEYDLWKSRQLNIGQSNLSLDRVLESKLR